MKKKVLMRIASPGLALLGAAMLSVAWLAYPLHLDNNPTMGSNRIALAWVGGFIFLAGIGILIFSLLGSKYSAQFTDKVQRLVRVVQGPYSWLVAPRTDESDPARLRRAGGYAMAAALVSIFLSVWYMTSGRFVKWTPSTVFFDRQANAFLAGKLALLEKPPEALAAIQNPYLVANRAGVSGYFWDSSYYKRHYYYYWGPVSGLVAAGIKLIHRSWLVEDQYLVLIAITCLALVQAALIHRLQERYFPHLGGWAVFGLTLLGILNTPVFWLVNHPVVHEVPIAFGQLFLMLGLYFAIRGMEGGKLILPWLVLTGLSWGAAIGSRLDLLFGIGWMVLLLGVYFYFKFNERKVTAGALGSLLLPLILWGVGLAWYNYARFGNIFETGHRYQLTGNALPADYRDIVSISYVLPNLYNLVGRPFEIHWHEFPYLFTPWIDKTMWPRLIFFPRSQAYFYGEPIAGLFPNMPSVWFIFASLIAVPIQALRQKGKISVSWKERIIQFSPSTWLGWMAGGAVLLNLAFLSLFIFSTLRYLADVTPLLTLLLTLCLGWASIHLHNRPRIWAVIQILAGLLIGLSIAISLLTNFQNGDWLFKTGNPALFHAIERFFNGGY